MDKCENKDCSAAKCLLTFGISVAADTLLLIVYLLICRLTDFALPRIISAAAVGTAIFFVCYITAKKTELKKIQSVISALLGFLIACYVHWAVYDIIDLQDNFYKPMKEISAYEYYGFAVLFPEDESFDDAFERYNSLSDTNGQSDWLSMGLNEILGETPSEAENSLLKSKNYTAFDFTFEYRNLDKITFADVIKSPPQLLKDIKSVNKTGRWKTSSKEKYNIHGTLLWAAWAGEFLLFSSETVLGALKGCNDKKV